MRIAVAVSTLVAVVTLLVLPVHPEALLVRAAFRATPSGLHPVAWDVIEWGGNVLVFAALALAVSVFVRSVRRVAGIAIGLSVLCELAQLLIPHRVASLSDLLLNATGSVIGALLAVVLRRRVAGSERPLRT